MFRTVALSIIRSSSLYTQQWYMSYRFADFLQAESGWNILILLASCQQTCMTYTIAVCTLKNSWWWREELSETCRVSFQNKCEKLVHLVGFIIQNLSRCTVTWMSITDQIILVRNVKGINYLGDQGVDGRIILKYIRETAYEVIECIHLTEVNFRVIS